ncbi:ABC transporter permease [Methylophilus aquaticus]|uniref:ABC transporter permease n=1 Tax=Methylophilus aquaticus TaxID=1971610 RepID=A0ABT9JU09_9PROT|nr:ABC transporter permease [Methylophilus aquaticus]MDP8567626.1 ABC transporter permease [Methylophilus aquaticus]
MRLASICILAVWLVAVVFGRWLGMSPNHIDLNAILQLPDARHWLGTDDLGRDILARVLHGVEVSLSVAMMVTVITMAIGVSIGLLAGTLGGRLDSNLMRLTDVFLAFPGMLLAIAFAAVLGAGINNLMLALCMTGWVSYARLSRGQALALRARPHVLAAFSLGAGPVRVMYRHVLPLMLSLLLVEATYSMASVMIAEASLSFLGLGIQPPQASWGAMLRDAVRFMLVAPHYVLAVGFCMMSLILAINLGGDWLRDRLDVRSEGQL